MQATIPIKAGVEAGTLDALRQLAIAGQALRAEIMDVPPASGTHQQRAAQRAAQREYVDSLRQAGVLLDSINACVNTAVRRDLDRRRWNGPFPAPPPEAVLPERRLGSRTHSYPEQLQARLPARLVAQVQAACWHHSRDAVQQIHQLHDRYSRGTIYRNPALLAHYDELADRITTPGDVYRSAVARLVTPPAQQQGTGP